MFYQILTVVEKEIDRYLRGNHSREFGIALLDLRMAIQKIKQFL